MIFTLKHPLAGFENINKLELSQIDDFFYKLENRENAISFTLINPFKLRSYEFDLPVYYKILLDAHENSKLLTLNTVIITSPPENSVINFIAPIIFNMDNQFAIQALLDTAKYPQFGITERISNFL